MFPVGERNSYIRASSPETVTGGDSGATSLELFTTAIYIPGGGWSISIDRA
jgi:hypothetical protein